MKESTALAQHEDIKKFVQGTVAESAPVIPISAQLKYNIDVIAEYIIKKIPIPKRDFISPPRMIVIRSFDVNKPGAVSHMIAALPFSLFELMLAVIPSSFPSLLCFLCP